MGAGKKAKRKRKRSDFSSEKRRPKGTLKKDNLGPWVISRLKNLKGERKNNGGRKEYICDHGRVTENGANPLYHLPGDPLCLTRSGRKGDRKET